MPLPTIIAVAALALGGLRLGLPYAGIQMPRWLANLLVVLCISLLVVAVVAATMNVVDTYHVQMQFVRNADAPSVDLSWPLAIIVAALVGGAMYGSARLLVRYDPEVRILSPLGGDVEWAPAVFGSVWPPDSDVQFFVFSRDHRWWSQPLMVHGAAWTCVPEIGAFHQESSEEFTYKLVAITGAPIVDKSVRTLPKGRAQSQIVAVKRK